MPDFKQYIDSEHTLHSVTGLLKRQLRFMLDPIIPETHYEAFIDIGRQSDEPKRIEQLNFVIKSLSSTSVVVLCELFRFLHYAKQFEAKSKMGPINFAIVIGPNILRTEAEIGNPMKAIDDNKHMQTTISTMIEHFEQILPSHQDLYKFDKATNAKWKYGVIGKGNQQSFPKRQSGLFDVSQNITADNTSSPILGSAQFVSFSKSLDALNDHKTRHSFAASASEIEKIKLKPTQSAKQPIAPSNTQTVDFRAVLNKNPSHGSKDQKEEKTSADIMNSPKLPPPNPIEVMSSEQKQKQKENTHILEVFQDFEDNMAQYDEEIDFKQSFAESIVSQIMELAENNKVVSAPKYAKKIEEKCRLVINAAKAHSQALQQFNQMLQSIYSQMEDEVDADADLIRSPSANYRLNGGANVTAGGDNEENEKENDNENEDAFDADDNALKSMSVHSQQNSYDHKAILETMSGGLPKYVSMTDMSQKNEPKKSFAKALFDYPGGYRSNELTFHRGTSLIITKEKEGWVYGCYELEPSLTGWFPKSYVKIISG